MLIGYQFPNVASTALTATNLDPILNATSNYGMLSDRRPGLRTLFKPSGAGGSSFNIQQVYNTTDGSLDINTLDYPYLLVGVVNIGVARYEGQILQPTAISFVPNGKWGAGVGGASCIPSISPSGFAHAWGLIPRSAKSGSTPTTTLTTFFAGDYHNTAGNFGIGEIVMCGVDEIMLADASMQAFDPTAIKRSGTGTPSMPMRNGYRKTQANLPPNVRDNVLGPTPVNANQTRTLQRLIFTAGRNAGCVIAPWYFRKNGSGNNVIDIPTMLECVHLAKLMDPLPSLGGNEIQLYKGALNFEELL